MNPVLDTVKKMLESNDHKFRGMKLPGAIFDGHDLKNADFRGASLVGASFKNCDLTYANFEGANCFGCDFTDAVLMRANFKDAQLANSKMFPKTLYGCTITLECKTFQGMQVAPGWWYGWLFYGLVMTPPNEQMRDSLIELLGPERYSVLRKQYARQGM